MMEQEQKQTQQRIEISNKDIQDAFNFLSELASEASASGKVHERRIFATQVVGKYLGIAFKKLEKEIIDSEEKADAQA
jgi:uncharacterized protein YjgD (DUF1641 family)